MATTCPYRQKVTIPFTIFTPYHATFS